MCCEKDDEADQSQISCHRQYFCYSHHPIVVSLIRTFDIPRSTSEPSQLHCSDDSTLPFADCQMQWVKVQSLRGRDACDEIGTTMDIPE